MNLCKIYNFLCKSNKNFYQSSVSILNGQLIKRYKTTDSNDNENKKASESKTEPKISEYHTEEIPPIPNYQPYPGDFNTKAEEEMNKIRSRFKYGVGPRMAKQFYAGPPIMRFIRMNKCPNRVCYRLVIQRRKYEPTDPIIEELGSYDPMPNRDGYHVFSINFERVKYHLGNRVMLDERVMQTLGLFGFLPVHPQSYIDAYRNVKKFESEKLTKQIDTEQKAAVAEQKN